METASVVQSGMTFQITGNEMKKAYCEICTTDR